ncbi:hypothetical protein GS489_30950 [Rhodococcus hoagii]|nr:hypothetical protein [Prescottella equi]
MGWDARKTGQFAAVAVVVIGGVAGAVVLSQPSDASDPSGAPSATSTVPPPASAAEVASRE